MVGDQDGLGPGFGVFGRVGLQALRFARSPCVRLGEGGSGRVGPCTLDSWARRAKRGVGQRPPERRGRPTWTCGLLGPCPLVLTLPGQLRRISASCRPHFPHDDSLA